MILADKITELRKLSGWSQEELADKLGVSRQSVSKWEMAQSTPDMNRIVMMAKLFGVSTDYLLLDEVEEAGTVVPDEDAISDDRLARQSVSMEEANLFLDMRTREALQVALGVFLCILSPTVVTVLGVAQEEGAIKLSDAQAVGIGCVFLFLCIGAAVALFVLNGIRMNRFEYLEKSEIDTAYGVDGMVRERRERFRASYTGGLAGGIALCVMSVLPIFVVMTFLGEDDLPMAYSTAALLFFIASGVFLIVRSCIVWGSFQILLQEGDYSVQSKLESKMNAPIAGIYWGIVVALFLGYSFITNRWDRSWIIWPVAGVCYGVLAAVLKIARKKA